MCEFIWILLCFIVILLAIRCKRYNLPPGIDGFPFIGRLPSKKTSLSSQVSKLRAKYGDIFRWRIGTQKCIFLCNYDLIKEAFQNPYLQGRPNFYTFKIITDFETEGIVNNEGNSLHNLRKFVLRNLAGRGVGKFFTANAIRTEAKALVEDFRHYCGKPTFIPWSVNAAVLNTIWRLVGGFRYDIHDERIQQLHQVLNDNFSHIQGRLFIFNFMPWLAYIIPRFIRRTILKERQFLEGIGKFMGEMKSVVEEHKKTFEASNVRDLIDAYLYELKQIREGGSNYSNENFSEKQLVHLVADLFGAASETTSSTIRWFLLFMVKFPEVQNKIQNEMDKNVPKDTLPTLEDMNKLPYFHACVHEILRCKAITPLAIFHAATENTRLKGYDIPKGTLVVAHIEGCHKEASYWERPLEFYPEHFLNQEGTFRCRKKYIPFSTGRRYCLGDWLAKSSLCLLLSALLQNYQFYSSKKEPLNLDPDPLQPLFVIPKSHEIVFYERK